MDAQKGTRGTTQVDPGRSVGEAAPSVDSFAAPGFMGPTQSQRSSASPFRRRAAAYFAWARVLRASAASRHFRAFRFWPGGAFHDESTQNHDPPPSTQYQADPSFLASAIGGTLFGQDDGRVSLGCNHFGTTLDDGPQKLTDLEATRGEV